MGFPSLALTRFWQPDRLLLVRASDALRLCGDGRYQQLPYQETKACLFDASRCSLAEVRELVRTTDPTSFSRSLFSDDHLFEQLRRAVTNQDLVVIREAGADATQTDNASTAKQRKVIREVERAARRGLGYQGRLFKLVADTDLARVPDRDSYEVVGHDDAVKVLTGLARQAVAVLATPLDAALSLLTADWRPPLRPDGLILLRRIAVRAAAADEEAPMGKPKQSGPAPAPEAAAAPEPDTVPPAVDQATQAQTLIRAAKNGAPFCEECARAAQQ
jgi:hypothetical protein